MSKILLSAFYAHSVKEKPTVELQTMKNHATPTFADAVDCDTGRN